jgi:hypothetical protein
MKPNAARTYTVTLSYLNLIRRDSVDDVEFIKYNI